MKIVAVPILDSTDVPWATERIIELYKTTKGLIHVVNVQAAYPGYVSRFFTGKFLERIHLEDGLQFLAPVARKLDEAGVPHWDHVLVGHKFEQIVEFVTAHHCSEVILRDEARNLLMRLGFASANTKIRSALRGLYHQSDHEAASPTAG